jgi:hypothetical protein
MPHGDTATTHPPCRWPMGREKTPHHSRGATDADAGESVPHPHPPWGAARADGAAVERGANEERAGERGAAGARNARTGDYHALSAISDGRPSIAYVSTIEIDHRNTRYYERPSSAPRSSILDDPKTRKDAPKIIN